ncbi:MAG: CBS domain-containing protein [Nanoarchaeota archaeon]
MKTHEICTDKVMMIDGDRRLSAVIGMLVQSGADNACVISEGNFKGVLSFADIFRSRIDSAEAKAKNYTFPTPKLASDATVEDSASKVLDAGVDAFPVYEDGTVIGGTSMYELVHALKPKLQGIAEEIETDLITVASDISLGRVLHLMHAQHPEAIAVTDRNETIIGVIYPRSLLEKYYLQSTSRRERSQKPNTSVSREFEPEKKSLLNLPAKNFMDDPVWFDGSHSIKEVAQRLIQARRPAAVSGQGRTVTIHSILRSLQSGPDEVGTIQFIGLSKTHVAGPDRAQIRQLSTSYGSRFQEIVHNLLDLSVHVKEFQSQGHRHRYEVHARASYPGDTVSTSAESWDVIAAVRETLEDLQLRLMSRYKSRTDGVEGQAGPYADQAAHE